MFRNNRKKFALYFGNDDIEIDSIILNPVHILPNGNWESEQEIDFYMDDLVNIYLLRIINRDENRITLVDYNDIRYIIVCIRVENTLDDLNRIVRSLKNIPYSEKITGKQKTYSFSL